MGVNIPLNCNRNKYLLKAVKIHLYKKMSTYLNMYSKIIYS